MRKKRISLIFITIFLLFIAIPKFNSVFSAEFRTESNKVITNVGNPPVDITAVSGAFSCPLKGTREIWCGSFMSDPKFNKNACAGAQPIDRGHCGRNYGCYKGSPELTNNQRRAHSIDVNGPAGETVYLPSINGQIAQWNQAGGYSVAQRDGGGYGHVFTSKLGNDVWILHLIHANPPPLIPPSDGKAYKSGDPVTTIAQTDYAHIHINLGKNPEGNNGGAGWLNPESLGMCSN